MKNSAIFSLMAISFTTAYMHGAEVSGKESIPMRSNITKSTGPLEENATYELRGFFGTGKDIEVSLAKKEETGSEWIRLGQKKGPVLIEQVDPATGTAILLIGGMRSTVRLATQSHPEAAPVNISYSHEEFAVMLSSTLDYCRTMTPEQQKAINEDYRPFSSKYKSFLADSEEAAVLWKKSAEIAIKVSSMPNAKGKIERPPAGLENLAKLSVEELHNLLKVQVDPADSDERK